MAHQHEAVIRLHHTDAAGVMFFPRIYELAHVAYEELLESIGEAIPQDLARASHVIPIVRSEADYRASLRLGDRIRVAVTVEALGSRSFTLAYAVHRRDAPDDAPPVATVRTVHVVVDTTTGRATHVPDGLRAGLASLREVAP